MYAPGLVTRTRKPAAAASCHPAEALVSVHCSRSYNSSLWSYDFDEGLEEDLKLVHITSRAPRGQGGVRGVGCSSTDGQSIGAHHAQQALWSGKGGDHVEVNWIITVCCLSSNQTVRGQLSGSLEHSSSQ